jgi:hypothetical protein
MATMHVKLPLEELEPEIARQGRALLKQRIQGICQTVPRTYEQYGVLTPVQIRVWRRALRL